MSHQTALELPVTVAFLSDWGVSTGAGIAGGVDAVVEKDERGRPVVRGTVITGAVREQAFIVAEALDGGTAGAWRSFVEALFGTAERSRLISFSDVRLTDGTRSDRTVHEVVSLSIDRDTGTAKKDHLRFFERVGACTLHGTATLLDTDTFGRPVPWADDERRATELVLALSGLLVRAIGSHRSDGDGLCDVLIGPATTVEGRRAAQTWCREQLKNWAGAPPEPPAPDASVAEAPVIGTEPRQSPHGLDDEVLYQANLDIVLRSPVISYEVPFSNEIRSLDFVRGTALLPLVHRRLRAAFGSQALVRDAVVNGDLLVSDATVVVGGVRGLPVPLVLSSPKVVTAEPGTVEEHGTDDAAGPRPRTAVLNRLRSAEPTEPHKPLRSGYVFPGHVPTGSGSTDDLAGAIGAPALLGRQSSTHNPLTGAAVSGQLFLTRSLPAGLRLRATVILSERLRQVIHDQITEVFPAEGFMERVGSRRLSGTYGRVHCTLGDLEPAATANAPMWEADDTTTLWFTSDVIARSQWLGPGGRVEDLLRAFEDAGAHVALVHPEGEHFSAGIRHRRVDSWAGADRQPRATRTAICAGSVLRVRPADGADSDAVMTALSRLSVLGVGELTAQGFGRFVVAHPWLTKESLTLTPLDQADMVGNSTVIHRSGPRSTRQEER
ncbi:MULTISPECIES: RAMP superfamily CRISPR-associated protein [Actinomyces]|uniref:CRISPR-associated protein Cmr3 n=1 Tax=Actinomyces respiraculi TaxID=2744574 RepID=A0A7T0LJV7_9ACTO|nr:MULTISPECIES: RAMP superfamily CRISPR-associated protein [Actinomyces]QPL05119.1 CRISPR-associated protein Cmr3 [Actinomyces respiraculi]